MEFRTSLGVDFEERCEFQEMENQRFGFPGEFYLETQWKPEDLVVFRKKRGKPREPVQKGKDLPIEMANGGKGDGNTGMRHSFLPSPSSQGVG